MKIVTDANIPYLPEAFQGIAEVKVYNAREINAKTVQDADLLFVRSTVQVGPALLEGSRVRFVATATIGVDHVDLPYLAARGISFASAPGSNSNSVAEWFVAALLTLAERQGFDPATKVIGVVGVGNVGSKVARNARALGARVLLCDPPLARKTKDPKYRPLAELLDEADILTLHVPLEKGGPDPTYHMFNAETFERIKPGAILINASRGKVVSEAALKEALDKKKLSAAILDVFESEPAVNPEIISRVALATPHIAGHSLDGKVNGTQMVYQAACRFLSRKPSWKPTDSLPPTPVERLYLPEDSRSDAALLLTAMRALYQIEEDDAFMREISGLPAEERAKRFSAYRSQYRVRREATYTRVKVPPGRDFLTKALATIGFVVES